MAAVKTNERPGTKAQVRYLRMSASKARVVLDLIRGKHVGEASEILAFSQRLASEAIDKCLRSAVANAVHNDEIPAEELYVSACYADEGPTLKRFRPRARGRAGRIHKQTCHITIVVSRYSDAELDDMRQRAEARAESGASRGGNDASADRRRRVARSRAADQVEEDTVAEDTVAEDTVADTAADDATVDTVVEDPVEDTVIEEVEADDVEAASAQEAADEAAADDGDAAEDEETN